MSSERNQRILVIDDDAAVHADFRKILLARKEDDSSLREARAGLFGDTAAEEAPPRPGVTYELASAFQGREARDMVQTALTDETPYAMAFVDMRMPPGWDGLETILQLWAVDPRLQIVICTAYTDHPWEDVAAEVGETDQLLILKKPFDSVEVRQVACALTEKWHAERSAELKLGELHKMVDERTLGIQAAKRELEEKNELLVIARSQADAANQAKSMFLATMSHELRTPMQAILGNVDLLASSAGTELDGTERERSLDAIARNGRHLCALINEILDLSKVEAGELRVESLETSPTEVVDEAFGLMQVQAERQALALELVFDGEVPRRLQTDPTRLRQILVNLLGNALKFTREGFVRLRVCMQPLSIVGARLIFEVQDSGIGMTEEQLARVFLPFSQAEDSTARRYGGTGLGLTLSRRLARLLGGEIEAESRSGEGSTFRLWLPVGEQAAADLVDPETEREARGTDSRPDEVLRRLDCRVLVVEDSHDNQRLISLVLNRAGASVELADNGRLAVERVVGAGPAIDCILMDMQMPVMDGYEATRRLRAAGFRGPILALTAHAMTGDAAQCLEAGCDAYAAKPIDRFSLVELIAAHTRSASPSATRR